MLLHELPVWMVMVKARTINPRRNRGQMTEWEKRKDMLKQRIRNKLNNAYKPENDKEFDAPCECRGYNCNLK